MADIVQVTVCGLGGQGILLIGGLLGEAAIRDGLWAAGSSSYGAQARGSGCRSELVISREPADFPHVLQADLLVAMAQGAYDQYLAVLGSQGLAVYDHPGVVPRAGDPRPHLGVPATATAVERFGSRQAANIVMLGALAALSRVVSTEALAAAVADSLDPRFREANQRALEAGLGLGEEALGAGDERLKTWRAMSTLGA